MDANCTLFVSQFVKVLIFKPIRIFDKSNIIPIAVFNAEENLKTLQWLMPI